MAQGYTPYTRILRRLSVEGNFMLFLPHKVVRLLVAFLRTDRFTERDPCVIEWVFAGKTERIADRASVKLDIIHARFCEHE